MQPVSHTKRFENTDVPEIEEEPPVSSGRDEVLSYDKWKSFYDEGSSHREISGSGNSFQSLLGGGSLESDLYVPTYLRNRKVPTGNEG